MTRVQEGMVRTWIFSLLFLLVKPPILTHLIHSAGNVLKELSEPEGAIIYTKTFQVGAVTVPY